jgi:hypothetical protein
VCFRLPLLAARVQAGQVRVGWAREVAARTRHLSVEAAAVVDAGMVECADGRVPWSRFCTRLAGVIVEADPETAARREAEAAAAVFAKATRATLDGVKGFYLRAPAALIIRFDATVAYLAAALRALGDRDNEDLRRVKACAILANPTQAVEILAAFAYARAHATNPADGAAAGADGAGVSGAGAGLAAGRAGATGPGVGVDALSDLDLDVEASADADPDADERAGDQPLPFDGNRDGATDPCHGAAADEWRKPGLDLDEFAPEPDADADADADAGRGPERGAGRHEQGGVPAPGDAADPGGNPLLRPRPFRPANLPGWLTGLTGTGSSPPGDPPTTSAGAGAGAGGWSFDWARLLPKITLYLHVSQETVERDQNGVVRWEGTGPITWTYVRDHISPYQHVSVAPVIDLAHQAPVDAYEIPDRHRRAVHLRTPADAFPYACSTADTFDCDHTDPYRPPTRGGTPGQSRLGNYTPLTRFHHRIKTHGHWSVKQPYDGIYLWRDPHGHFYLVDHTGTRKISPPGPRPPDTGRPRDHDPEINLYPAETILQLQPDRAPHTS